MDVKLSKGIDTKAEYDGKLAREILFKVNNNMVSGDDSVKKGTQLSLLEESCIYLIKIFLKITEISI